MVQIPLRYLESPYNGLSRSTQFRVEGQLLPNLCLGVGLHAPGACVPSSVDPLLTMLSSRQTVATVERAANAEPRPRFHDLRHTAASLLISEGLNVVYVSRQLGHASPDVTLRIYAHLFDRAEHAQRASAALEAGFGHLLFGGKLSG